jgi:3-isopropylmalate dehydrogenase
MKRIALIPGDGIGSEVLAEASRVLDAAVSRHGLDIDTTVMGLGAERYLQDGITITGDEFEALRERYDAILLGALGDPRVPDNIHARDILLGLRFKLDLYINHRPCVLLDPALSPLRDPPRIRLDIFRENTEGLYVGMGGRLREGTPDEIAVQELVNTRRGVERIVRAAFEFAERQDRRRVTLVDKANVMSIVGGLWRRVFAEVGQAHPGVEQDTMYIDAMAMDLVRRPGRYDVIVTSNLFGDILSDLAAEITGGLGLAPSANIHPGRHALFEPVHGSAPDIAGQGVSNPVAAIRCVAMLLDYLNHDAAAASVEAAVLAAVVEGILTPDLGGTSSTREVGAWIAEAVVSR